MGSDSNGGSGSSGTKDKARRRNLRWAVLRSGLVNYLCSPLFLSVVALAVSTAVYLLTNRVLPLLAVIFITVVFYQRVMFEFFVMTHVIEASLGTFTWFHKIEENIYLGGIPMDMMNHLSLLSLDLNVTAVLAIVQDFEINSRTIMGRPVSPAQWESEGVTFKRISSVDFSPPDHAVLDEAADFIDYNIKQKKVVYIHCKSGIGRSASGLVAYLVKHRGMPVHTAVAYVRSKRPNIFSQTSRQMQNLINYDAIIKQKKQTSFVKNAEP